MITDWTLINQYEERYSHSTAAALDAMSADIVKGNIDGSTDQERAVIEYVRAQTLEHDRFVCSLIFG